MPFVFNDAAQGGAEKARPREKDPPVKQVPEAAPEPGRHPAGREEVDEADDAILSY